MTNEEKLRVEDILPLTDMQNTMLFSYLLYPKSKMYFEQQKYRLNGILKMDLIRKAWCRVAENNEMLRSALRWKDLDFPVLVIYENKKLPITLCNTKVPFVGLTSYAVEEMLWEKEGNLEGNLYSLYFCQISESEIHMIVCSHHIILDGWSHFVLIREFIHTYSALLKNEKVENRKKTPFKDYICLMKSGAKSSASGYMEFWDKYLAGCLNERRGYGSSPKIEGGTGIYSFPAGLNMYHRMKESARSRGVTQASIIYGAWGILMLQISGRSDVIFGVTLSGRNIELGGVADMAGLFIRTLPMTICSDQCHDKDKLLNKISSDLTNIQSQSYIGLKELLYRYHYLSINNVVVIQNYTEDFSSSCGDILKVDLISSHYKTDIDLVLSVKVIKGEVEMEFCYNNCLYTEDEIVAMSCSLCCILEDLV